MLTDVPPKSLVIWQPSVLTQVSWSGQAKAAGNRGNGSALEVPPGMSPSHSSTASRPEQASWWLLAKGLLGPKDEKADGTVASVTPGIPRVSVYHWED